MRLHVTSKYFGDQQVLGSIDLTLKNDEVTVLLGPSGCGKSTLLNILCGLDDSFDGELEKNGDRIAMVFQEPRLLPWLTVKQNIELVAPGADAHTLIKNVGIGDALDVPAAKLSLGMARRAAFARALAINPDILIMDEPFVSLDEERADSLRLMVLDLMDRQSCKALFVTHDVKEAVQLGHRILVMGNSPSQIINEKSIDLTPAERRDSSALQNYLKTFALS